MPGKDDDWHLAQAIKDAIEGARLTASNGSHDPRVKEAAEGFFKSAQGHVDAVLHRYKTEDGDAESDS